MRYLSLSTCVRLGCSSFLLLLMPHVRGDVLFFRLLRLFLLLKFGLGFLCLFMFLRWFGPLRPHTIISPGVDWWDGL